MVASTLKSQYGRWTCQRLHSDSSLSVKIKVSRKTGKIARIIVGAVQQNKATYQAAN
jgi:hypothetical protein